MSNLLKYFPSLSCKNYRYYFFGQSISIVGTWIQSTSQQWYVTELFSEASFYLGLLTSIQFIPMMFFSLFVGVFIERFNKRKALMITQGMLMILAIIQGVLILSNIMNYGMLLLFSLILGFINAFDLPIRQVIISEIVGDEYIINAVALNSALFNGARIIGPSISGMLISYFGTGVCFLLNGITFIPVILGVYKMKLEKSSIGYTTKLKGIRNIFRDIVDGLKYINNNKYLMSLLLSVAFFGVFGFNYSVLIPVLSREVFNLESHQYGFLMSSLGLGALVSSVVIAILSKKINRKVWILISIFILSLFLMILGISKNIFFVAFMLFLIGVFNIIFSTSANSSIQLIAGDKYKGRVMSIYSLLFTGLTPIGSLYSGILSGFLGPGFSFLISGIILFVFTSILIIVSRKSFFVKK